eukprot:scaffold3335_cov30-Tisochrysis_lutea.AAC.3
MTVRLASASKNKYRCCQVIGWLATSHCSLSVVSAKRGLSFQRSAQSALQQLWSVGSTLARRQIDWKLRSSLGPRNDAIDSQSSSLSSSRQAISPYLAPGARAALWGWGGERGLPA